MQKASRIRPDFVQGKPQGPRPLTLQECPQQFVSDHCLRCGTLFADTQICAMVSGGPQARYRDIHLVICQRCVLPPSLDRQRYFTCYRSPHPDVLRIGTWPRYIGHPGRHTGYVKVAMLDNGLAMVGLHRGHVEVWSLAEMQASGGVLGSYSADYTLYGGPGVFYHQVIEVRFYDLADPIPPERAATTDENRFLCGGTP